MRGPAEIPEGGGGEGTGGARHYGLVQERVEELSRLIEPLGKAWNECARTNGRRVFEV